MKLLISSKFGMISGVVRLIIFFWMKKPELRDIGTLKVKSISD